MERAVSRVDAGLAERVHLLGAVARIERVHEAADVLLATSRSEGMPVAMIEAAAAARPVVTTAVGGVPELVISGLTGLFGTDRDALAVASRVSWRIRGARAARTGGQEARLGASRGRGARRRSRRGVPALVSLTRVNLLMVSGDRTGRGRGARPLLVDAPPLLDVLRARRRARAAPAGRGHHPARSRQRPPASGHGEARGHGRGSIGSAGLVGSTATAWW